MLWSRIPAGRGFPIRGKYTQTCFQSTIPKNRVIGEWDQDRGSNKATCKVEFLHFTAGAFIFLEQTVPSAWYSHCLTVMLMWEEYWSPGKCLGTPHLSKMTRASSNIQETPRLPKAVFNTITVLERSSLAQENMTATLFYLHCFGASSLELEALHKFKTSNFWVGSRYFSWTAPGQTILLRAGEGWESQSWPTWAAACVPALGAWMKLQDQQALELSRVYQSPPHSPSSTLQLHRAETSSPAAFCTTLCPIWPTGCSPTSIHLVFYFTIIDSSRLGKTF